MFFDRWFFREFFSENCCTTENYFYFCAVMNHEELADSTPYVYHDGCVIWKNADGQWHRLDGPAWEYPNGTKQWWVNHFLHRLDGPAIEWADGGKSWYINGEKYTEEEWAEKVAQLKTDKEQ